MDKNEFKKSILAGFMIGLASFCYCQSEIKQFGMVLFCGGLYVVCRYALNLYTGKVGYFDFKRSQVFKYWQIEQAIFLFFVLSINVVVSFFTGYFFNYGHTNAMAEVIVNNFNTMSYLDIFIKSFGCGVCMYLSVDIWKKHNNVLGIFLFVPIFLSCGFLHSVAIPAFYGICGTIPPIGKLLFVAFGNGIGSIIIENIKKE